MIKQIEDLNPSYFGQSKEDENESYYQEPKEEELFSNEKENNIINNEDKNSSKTLKIKESTSKRLRSLPKTYHTYTILFKKQVIEEVNLNL